MDYSGSRKKTIFVEIDSELGRMRLCFCDNHRDVDIVKPEKSDGLSSVVVGFLHELHQRVYRPLAERTDESDGE